MANAEPIPILYRDEDFIAVHKPPGLFVHRTKLSPEKDVLLQRVRNQIGIRIFPIHRLDRPTSGVVIFAFNATAARKLCLLFEERQVTKSYLAVVRGFADEQGEIDSPLLDFNREKEQEAITHYRRLATQELPIAVGRYATARFSLVEALPKTGRYHQIRRHLSRAAHPIIGDSAHGDIRQNRLFRDHLGVSRLLLQARSLAFLHPDTGEMIRIEALPEPELVALFRRLGWSYEQDQSVETSH